jgi:hypothetical protein
MDWKNIVGTLAPWIGTALGGPLGGAAVTAVADALGLSEKTEGAIKQALAGVTPEQMLAIRNADNGFALKMQELGFSNTKDMEALAVSDRDSARKREMALGDKTTRNLAYAITAGFFSVLGYMLVCDVPDGSRDVLNIMLGSLGTAWVGVNAYYFGSTRQSAAKTDLLAKAQPIKD